LADTVEGADDSDFLGWVFNKHIPDVLNSRRFESVEVFRRTEVTTCPA